MFATFIIGLREGLEAALIVSIIATFLKRNGQSLRTMWFGVIVATLLSIAVGVGLNVTANALPQAQQEALESVIGAIAIIFVTSMILWMDAHARDLKHDLESEATDALKSGHAWAMAGMAFLAVLKEGFETSVFLLATIQASGTSALSMVGAAVGIGVAVVLGIGIYIGGIRLNLSKFFRITGVFLVLVAAGLVMSTLRTAHEAGWLNAGQQPTVDLSWLVPNGSFSSAIITGIFGIPADPRLIEVVGWITYLVAVMVYLFWPRTHRSQHPIGVASSFACAFTVVAIILAVAGPVVAVEPQQQLAVTRASAQTSGTSTTTATVHLHHLGDSAIQLTGLGPATRLHQSGSERIDGVEATEYSARTAPTSTRRSMTLDDLASWNHGRLPVGIDSTTAPGPFMVALTTSTRTTALVAHENLVSVTQTSPSIATLSGGGLSISKTVTLQNPASASITTEPSTTTAAMQHAQQMRISTAERLLWNELLPLAYLVLAAIILSAAILRRRRERKSAAAVPPIMASRRSQQFDVLSTAPRQ